MPSQTRTGSSGPRLKRSNKMGANIDLSDADGMHPKDMSIGDRLFEFGVVSPEPLPKSFYPAASPPHFQEIIRSGKREQGSEQQIVKRFQTILGIKK